jgi:hypothetical protein
MLAHFAVGSSIWSRRPAHQPASAGQDHGEIDGSAKLWIGIGSGRLRRVAAMRRGGG